MCGFAGIARREPRGVNPQTLARMAASIRHRGPDGFGLYAGERFGVAHVRLSIIDVGGGAQPMTNEDGRIVVAYNGEVYNYVALRRQLERTGHRFRTRSDTEVLVHAYEEWGPAMLDRLNGQFAFVIYDRRSETVFMARDRFGIHPLVYARRGADLYFASEAKALFASNEVPAVPDLLGIDEVFAFWAAQPPRTVFVGVNALEPGCYAVWSRGTLRIERYFTLDFAPATHEMPDALEQLDELMRRSVALRMRADVPVGAYLSGGLDSSVTSALGAAASPHKLRTFSVTFDDPGLDERRFQDAAATALRTSHHARHIGEHAVADVFPSVVWHAETPLLRTAPAPMYLLSSHTRQHGIKVVLTGEGADEVFLGYDVFKEVAVREFCDRDPSSTLRPRLFDALYPYLRAPSGGGELWRQFFRSAAAPGDLLASHRPRIRNARFVRQFYSPDTTSWLGTHDVVEELRVRLAPRLQPLSALDRAAFLEFTTLLSPYLLASQGDRMALAHGVEARFPFLDHEVFRFAARLPANSKLQGLHEKQILRRWATRIIPAPLASRPKQPYRAPDTAAFFGATTPEYVHDLLTSQAIERGGMFAPAPVHALLRRCRAGTAMSVRENQAFVGILSLALWADAFFGRGPSSPPLSPADADVFIHDAPIGVRPAGALT
jgi:asparagine synthase (glutamine-hydrolysing)